jgi:hypothetical protein
MQTDRDDCQALFTGKPRQYITVTAVVTGTADDCDTLSRRPAAAQRAERSFAGASHQRVGRNLQIVDRVPVQRAHLVRGVNGDGQTAHG